MKRLIILVLLLASTSSAFAQSNFVVPSDIPRRYPSYIRPATAYVDAKVLAANVAEVWTAPANTRFVIFSANCDFYAKPNAAAAVPAADVSNGTASTLNPAGWYFSSPVVTIGLISATACTVTIEAYLGPIQ